MSVKRRRDFLVVEAYAEYLSKELEAAKQAIAELEPRAAFGDQCIQDGCENAYVEQSVLVAANKRIAKTEETLRELVHQIDLSNGIDDNGHELKNLKVLAEARKLVPDGTA